jgi:hypothetical protein
MMLAKRVLAAFFRSLGEQIVELQHEGLPAARASRNPEKST